MAAHLKTPLAALALAACALTLQGAARAEVLADPTRPPNAADMNATGSAPLLQSIKFSPSGATAMVNGRLLRVGDRLDDSKVMKITETELVLARHGALQTLRIFPDIQTWPAASDAPRANPTSR
jgi:MSHA biogenesis protein MshK